MINTGDTKASSSSALCSFLRYLAIFYHKCNMPCIYVFKQRKHLDRKNTLLFRTYLFHLISISAAIKFNETGLSHIKFIKYTGSYALYTISLATANL